MSASQFFPSLHRTWRCAMTDHSATAMTDHSRPLVRISDCNLASRCFSYSVSSAFFRKACFSKYLSDDLPCKFSSSFTSALESLNPFQSSADLSMRLAFLGPATNRTRSHSCHDTAQMLKAQHVVGRNVCPFVDGRSLVVRCGKLDQTVPDQAPLISHRSTLAADRPLHMFQYVQSVPAVGLH